MDSRPGFALAAVVLALMLQAGCASPDSTADSIGSSPQVSLGDIPEGWGDPDTWVKADPAYLVETNFVVGVDNPRFPLVAGTRWVYDSDTREGTERIEVEVLEETRTVSGIGCIVVRDTVSVDGELVEDTHDWYAQDRDGNVWYMGEDSKEYENGKVVSTAGSWEAGVDGALPGIKMWAEPRIGGTPYYQEYYEGEAEDLARDIEADGSAAVPFGRFVDVLVVEEWNPLEPETIELKYYARGVGVVMEEVTRGGGGVVELVEFEAP